MSTADFTAERPRGRWHRHERRAPWLAYDTERPGAEHRDGCDPQDAERRDPGRRGSRGPRPDEARERGAVPFGPMDEGLGGRSLRGPRGPRGPRDGWGGPRGRRRGQAARGDVRAAILTLLAESPMHGYQMIGELAERSGGVWRPSPGSVYPTLSQLEDEGLVTADESSGRRVFSLTDAGREHVAARPAGPAPWEAMAASDRHQLHDLVRRLGIAVAQVDEAGSTEQRARTAELLEQARKSVYRVLAEDETG